MMVLQYIIILMMVYQTVFCGSGNRWHYHGHLGPKHWHVDYEHCGGRKQSPINVDTSLVELDTSLPNFDVSSYHDTDDVEQELENVGGHTVEVIYSGKDLIVSGGGLDGEFKVDQFHFHWGRVDARGSEHQINGEQYPMEMHIVHHSTKYHNLTVALPEPKALAVNAFFVEAGEHNENFEKLLEHFDAIDHAGDSVELDEPIKLSDLLPDDMSVFYRYDGSLTTPPCYETVIWTIFKNPIVISEEQLNKYRHMKRNKEGEPEHQLVDDFRPLQALNNRVVLTNNELGLSAANTNTATYLCFLVVCLVSIGLI